MSKVLVENTNTYTMGLSVYSVKIVANPAKGLEMKLVMPKALPLIRIGNSN